MATMYDVPVLDEPVPAIDILARALQISTAEARTALRALVEAGYVIGPREPTNAMLLAYVEAHGQPPLRPQSMITAIGKARRRWKAMADKATAMALSVKRVAPHPAGKPVKAEGAPKTGNQSAGGRARAERLAPERRREIARDAARRRWHREPPEGERPSGNGTMNEKNVLNGTCGPDHALA